LAGAGRQGLAEEGEGKTVEEPVVGGEVLLDQARIAGAGRLERFGRQIPEWREEREARGSTGHGDLAVVAIATGGPRVDLRVRPRKVAA